MIRHKENFYTVFGEHNESNHSFVDHMKKIASLINPLRTPHIISVDIVSPTEKILKRIEANK